MPSPIAAADITLGLLAGGRGMRLGGVDKAWLLRNGTPRVLHWARRFATEHGALLISANRDLARYAAHGLHAVPDRAADAGPLGGLDALAAACTTPWLWTLPVDLIDANDCLLRTLIAACGTNAANGAYAADDDGPQPLVALWRRDVLRVACTEALAAGEGAVHRLHARLGNPEVRFRGLRFGNLNTPDDLAAAGVAIPPGAV
jgi:molybdopterin-guanine dinucleotide biosynthesis protein A